MAEDHTQRLNHAREQLRRLAGLALKIAAAGDVVISAAPGRCDVVQTRTRYASGRDAIEIEWTSETRLVDAYEDGERVPIGIEMPPSLIPTEGWTLEHTPADIAPIMHRLVEVLRRDSMDGERLVLPWGDDDAPWRMAAERARGLSDQSPGVEVRISQERGRVHLETRGRNGETPSDAAKAMAAALPPMEFLTWTNANSAQALAKRRQHGTPPLGRAEIRRSPLKWKAQKGAPRKTDDSPIAVRTRPVSLVSIPERQPDERFAWRLSGFHGFEWFTRAKPDVRALLARVLRLDHNTTLGPPMLVRRGSRWSDMDARPADRINLRAEELDTLVRGGFLHQARDADEETWEADFSYHELLRALAGAGYADMAGITEVRAEEMVPQGIATSAWSHGHGVAFGTVDVRDAPDKWDREFTHGSHQWPSSPASRAVEPDGQQMRVVRVEKRVFPDFGELARSNDGVLHTTTDPSRDARRLRGPLADLYRMPVEDRVLVVRYVNSRRMDEALRIYDHWGW